MRQAFLMDDLSGKANVQFVVIVKMCELFAAVEQGREPIISARQWTILHPEFLEPSDQLVAQRSHLVVIQTLETSRKDAGLAASLMTKARLAVVPERRH